MIDALRTELPITDLCKYLGLSRAAYYRSARPKSKRAERHRRSPRWCDKASCLNDDRSGDSVFRSHI